MTLIECGKVQGGGIVFPKPLPLPEGTEVTVHIKLLATRQPPESHDFASLPFFGMWADRQEMRDSVAWVQKEREQWQQRLERPA